MVLVVVVYLVVGLFWILVNNFRPLHKSIATQYQIKNVRLRIFYPSFDENVDGGWIGGWRWRTVVLQPKIHLYFQTTI